MSEFDQHWEQASKTQRPQAKIEAARQFLRPILDSAATEDNLTKVLDVGCGDGVHIHELLNAGRQFDVTGVDYSVQALASATRITGEWLPVHADAQNLPFADESFDAVISFGVQAYLDNPQKGMAEVVRVAKTGGLIGLWYAPGRKGLSGMLFAVSRSIVPRLPRQVQVLMADLLVPFLGLMPTASTLSLRTGSWAECREVILVNIAPRKIAFPTREEVESGLQRLGCELVEREGAIKGEYWARKIGKAGS